MGPLAEAEATMKQRSGSSGIAALASVVAMVVLLLSMRAWATTPVRVRVNLAQRGTQQTATYVLINVDGTQAPIRLVRRVAGTCTRDTAVDGRDVLARVACDTQDGRVVYEVARNRTEIVVRRGAPVAAATDVTPVANTEDEAMMVISRAPLPDAPVVSVE